MPSSDRGAEPVWLGVGLGAESGLGAWQLQVGLGLDDAAASACRSVSLIIQLAQSFIWPGMLQLQTEHVCWVKMFDCGKLILE